MTNTDLTPAFPREVREVRPDQPEVSSLPRTFHDVAGYNLAKWMLFALCFIIVLLLAGIAISEPRSPSSAAADFLVTCMNAQPDASKCTPDRIELAKSLLPASGDVAAYREYWKGMFERVVGTTLLPIVTALLGFLFGAQGRASTNAPQSKERT